MMNTRRFLAAAVLLFATTAACTTPGLPPPQTPTATTATAASSSAAPSSAAASSSASSTGTGLLTVQSVYDGDTLRVVELEESVRVLGIDTPEVSPKECFGIEARSEARELLPVGSKVRLVADLSQKSPDRYGRTLAYVETESGQDFAAAMLSQGAARVYEEYPVARTPQYLELQAIAQVSKEGLWASC